MSKTLIRFCDYNAESPVQNKLHSCLISYTPYITHRHHFHGYDEHCVFVAFSRLLWVLLCGFLAVMIGEWSLQGGRELMLLYEGLP